MGYGTSLGEFVLIDYGVERHIEPCTKEVCIVGGLPHLLQRVGCGSTCPEAWPTHIDRIRTAVYGGTCCGEVFGRCKEFYALHFFLVKCQFSAAANRAYAAARRVS